MKPISELNLLLYTDHKDLYPISDKADAFAVNNAILATSSFLYSDNHYMRQHTICTIPFSIIESFSL